MVSHSVAAVIGSGATCMDHKIHYWCFMKRNISQHQLPEDGVIMSKLVCKYSWTHECFNRRYLSQQ